MSLNNITLSSRLMADWYSHSLVESVARAVPQLPPVPCTGKGGKNILIVVAKPSTPGLPDDELVFLTKVLSACQLGLADVAIVNWSKAPHQNASAIMEQFNAASIILFGVEPAAFGLPNTIPLYSVATLHDRQFVAAPHLPQIEKTKETKAQLWAALKQLFCI